MIIAILIILTFIINCLLIVYTRQEQEWNFKILSKTQEHMWDDITQIGRNARAIDRKIDLNQHLKKD